MCGSLHSGIYVLLQLLFLSLELLQEVETIIHRYGFLLGIHAKKRVDWYAVDECKMILKLMVIGG